MATIKNIHDYGDIINLPYKKSKKYKMVKNFISKPISASDFLKKITN